ncbi:tetratricopeptide repeat protein [Paenirhodobacter populi]
MTRNLLMFLPFLIAACAETSADRAVKSMNAVDQATMSEIMLTVGEPQEAVNYFARTSAEHPDRIDLQRGLAKSLVRNGQASEGLKVWDKVTASPDASNDDRVARAEAQMRIGDWKGARATLNTIPPTFESYDRYRIEAMVADSEKNWKKADSFYDTAAGLTTRPAGILNNWGFSKLSRGDAQGAEKLFAEAITYDPTAFTSKNNLVLARAAQRKYDMPVIEMTQTERAQLLYTAGLSAIKQGDTATGQSLLQDAVDTSPTYFEEAARALAALGEAQQG